MTPSFFDELEKMAEVQEATWPRIKDTFGRVLVGGAAAGLGGATGHLLGNAILPKVLPKASTRTLKILSGLGTGLSAAGGLAAVSAMNRHRKMQEAVEE